MRKKLFAAAGVLFLAFAIFTVLVGVIDVRPVGPDGSEVGFATLNLFVFRTIGVHMVWYHITDWLGVIAILIAFAFAVTGLCQLIRRRSLRKVDRSIWVLGGFYLLAVACYVFFEQVIVNYRPIVIGQEIEASYPSSHTMSVVCIMATAAIQLHELCAHRAKLCRGMNIFSAWMIAITVVGRLISGVHWFTDIVGGLLLSSALVVLYCAVIRSKP